VFRLISPATHDGEFFTQQDSLVQTGGEESGEDYAGICLRVGSREARCAGQMLITKEAFDGAHESRSKRLAVNVWREFPLAAISFKMPSRNLMNSRKPGVTTTRCPSPRIRRPSNRNSVRSARSLSRNVSTMSTTIFSLSVGEGILSAASRMAGLICSHANSKTASNRPSLLLKCLISWIGWCPLAGRSPPSECFRSRGRRIDPSQPLAIGHDSMSIPLSSEPALSALMRL